jgi:hypothetical protein
MCRASGRVAQGLCNKTSSTISYRSCRARNPWEPCLARELAATCCDDARGCCKSLPRNSPRHTPAAQHLPSAHTKPLPPADKAMQPPIERDVVFSYSQEPDTTPDTTQ